MSNVLYPAKFCRFLRVRPKMHAYTAPGCSGMSFWGEYQVKAGRKIVGRAPTLAEVLKKFPSAVVCSNWPDDEDLAREHNEALFPGMEAA